jgi:hypothetical protein
MVTEEYYVKRLEEMIEKDKYGYASQMCPFGARYRQNQFIDGFDFYDCLSCVDFIDLDLDLNQANCPCGQLGESVIERAKEALKRWREGRHKWQQEGYDALNEAKRRMKHLKTFYFPNLVFGEELIEHERRAENCSKHLEAMDEPSLWKQRKDCRHNYRFLWLRTFDKPICIRLTINRDGGAILFAKRTSWKGGWDPGVIVDYKTKALQAHRVNQFLEKIESIDFWELPTCKKEGCIDMARWILEGVRDGKYHIVHRCSPGGDFADTALLLIKYSDLEVENIYGNSSSLCKSRKYSTFTTPPLACSPFCQSSPPSP